MWCWNSLSPDSQEVMRLAHQECDRLGHPYFGGEHLLLGLLAHGTGTAARLLTAHGLGLDGVRTETDRIVTTTTRTGGAVALRELGIDLGEIHRRLEASFGPAAVHEATRRVARRPWWRGRARPTPLWRQPFLVKRALEIAAKHSEHQGQTTVEPEHLLYGVLLDARDPLGTAISRHSRHNGLLQIGLRSGGLHPVRLLLQAHGVEPDQLRTELDGLR